MRGRVLIVAGSDSGGGAGIQADIKTVTALDAYAATAITALTVQDTLGVHGIHEVPVEVIADQMRVVLGDIGADVIKTGMLHNAQVIEAVAAVIDEKADDVPLVVDPVMVAKGGARLLDETASGALVGLMVARSTVLTPNLPEAEALTGLVIEGVDAMKRAGEALLEMGPDYVLVKGGHLESEDIIDVLMSHDEIRTMSSPRIATRSTHGTGCTLASAIAAGMAHGLDPAEAIGRARDYVLEAIRTAPNLGKGHGPLNHAHTVRPFEE